MIFAALQLEETEESKVIQQSSTGAAEPDEKGSWSAEECAKAESAVLEEVEALEERVFSASLQVKVSRQGQGQSSRPRNLG